MDLTEMNALASREETYPLQRVDESLEILELAGWYPPYHPIEGSGTDPLCVMEGRERIVLCSNNYLGLSRDARVVEGAREVLATHGLGPGGSRFLCGNTSVLPALDRAVADLVGCEDAITFPTGYMANLSVFKAVLGPFLGVLPYRRRQAAVIADEWNHATVFDGIQLSEAKRFLFAHNDLADLEKKLVEAKDHSPRLVVTEGVYSLDGEVTPLPAIVELAKKHGAVVMVDDAHGLGVMGARGGGTVQHFGLEGEVDIVMGSFDKALGGMGGFLAGRKDLVRWLRAACRAYLFSSALPSVMAGGMLRAIEACRDGAHLRARLHANAARLRAGFEALGFQVLGNGQLPVLPVVIGSEERALAFSQRLYELGVFVPCFRWPAVPRGTARIRATPMASHTDAQLDAILAAFRQAGEELGVLPARPAATAA